MGGVHTLVCSASGREEHLGIGEKPVEEILAGGREGDHEWWEEAT